MIRILQVFNKMDMGGAENLIMNIYRGINRKKFQFDFVVHSDKKGVFDEEIEALGGKIIYISKLTLININKYKRQWINLLSKKNYDIIHGHMQSTAAIYLKIAKDLKMKTICHSHTTSYGKGIKAIAKKFLQRNIGKYCDFRLACSKLAGEWLFGKNLEFKVIKNGIDVKKFEFDEIKRASIREKLFIKNEFTIGHVGRFDKAKNQEFLVDIFAEYLVMNPNSKLILVGDGVLKQAIEDKVRLLGIENCVIFLGNVNNVNEIYMSMDFFIFPSIYEGLPLTLIEAQASGLTILASDGVSNETKITDNIEFINLNDKKKWLDSIKIANQDRKSINVIVNNSGYDCCNTINDLITLYES